MRRFLIIAASLGLVASPLPAQAAADRENSGICEACEGLLDLALAHPRRAGDRDRDQYRHPAETLAFFGVEPGMTIVDFMPSGGWYTRILVPYLGEGGHYIGLNPNIGPDASAYQARMRDTANILPVQVQEWTGGTGAKSTGANVGSLPEELAGTADRVLIFREIHNMFRFNWLYDSLRESRRLLKEDGLLGIVQHRARPEAPASYTDGNKGYMREQDVIGLIEAHGFELVARSEINANPRDTADWPAGVWALPPVLRTGQDEERYRAIGESDRMTLLFRKRP